MSRQPIPEFQMGEIEDISNSSAESNGNSRGSEVNQGQPGEIDDTLVNQEATQERGEENEDQGETEGGRKESDSEDDSSNDSEQKEEKSEFKNDEDEDEELMVRKRKAVLDSDDDDEESGDGSPTAKKRVLSSSSDSDSDDDEKSERNKEKSPEKNEARKLLGSDVSDDSDNEGGQEEVGELMANIFGDDSDEEGEGRGQEPPAEENQDDGGEDEYRKRNSDDEDNNFESDFDAMMRRKKAERKRSRKRRGDGIDIINDDDGRIAAMVDAMKNATKDDRLANLERRPALRKRKMLHEVKTMLLRADMTEAMIENGMMSAVSDWLSPLPDKSLPALEIRTELLKLLQDFSRLDQGVLKQSGLGKAVMMLFKHPKEVKENKELAARLIRAWSRPIFQLDTDFRAISREEREHRDQERMPEIKRRRNSNDAGPSSSKQDELVLKPGDKGYIGRARVPRPSTRDYVVRPKHVVEGEFKGERKGRAYARLDKTQRDFNERTKKLKTKRAVQVSLEGRNLSI